MKMRKCIAGLLSILTISSIFSACSSNSGKKLGYQLNLPEQGEEVAVFTTDMGTIKMRLFPEAAPKAVENFKGLIQKGYYNGLIFHRVIKDFMIQTGDPSGNGTGGSSIWNKPFDDEYSDRLINIRGAVAMANSGKNTNGSQFFINQAGPSAFKGWSQYEQGYKLYKQYSDTFTAQYGTQWINMDKASKDYRSLYEKYGGNPFLDGAYNIQQTGYTVFAQVYEGMDAVDKIASVKVDSNDKPISSVKIIKAEIQKYKK